VCSCAAQDRSIQPGAIHPGALPRTSSTPPHADATAQTFANALAAARQQANAGAAGAPKELSSPARSGALTRAEIYPGPDASTNGTARDRPPVTVGDNGAVMLNFINAGVREVVDAILGDILKVGYAIDPTVDGTITIRSSSPVARADVIPALESVLTMNGIALTRTGDIYRVLPLDKAPPIGQTLAGSDRPQAAGFGSYVIPLRYAAAPAVADTIKPFVPTGRILTADAQRNFLVFAGTGVEARGVIELAETFDIDLMANKSFALFPVTVAPPEIIVEELDRVFSQQDDTALPGAVRFVPIDRLKAVLVIASQRESLTQAQTWIRRLDRGEGGNGRRLHTYAVQNGRAIDLAETLGLLYHPESAVSREPSVAPGLEPLRIGRSRSSSGGFNGGGRTLTGSPSGASTSSDRDGFGTSTGTGTSEFGERSRMGAGTSTGTRAGTSSPGSSRSSPGAVAVGGGDDPRIIADDRTNTLLILATADEYRMIEETLRNLDTLPLQVLIEATIAEVTLNDDLRYGLQWFFNSGSSNFVFSSRSDGVIAPSFPGFNYLFNGQDARVVLNALTEITDVNVISSPQLMVLNNQSARLQVGDQVPVPVQQAISVQDTDAPLVSTIQFRDTGVILEVTPRVNNNGLVLLDIIQEVSDVSPTPASSLDAPTILQRRIESSVVVRSNEPVALGGLIRDDTRSGRSGIPILSDIPVLGNLFKTTSNSKSRTELLVLITPRIVATDIDARLITDELRRRLSRLQGLDRRIQ
jgi:general secretion pathway protein D